MFFCRYALVLILCFLLLSPFIKSTFNKTEKPIIIFAQDNSSSILLNADSNYYKTTYLSTLSEVKSELSKNFELDFFSFDEKIEKGKKINFSGKTTNLSNVLDEINNKYYNRNIGAIILASDGIFNQGSNPIYTINSSSYPIYTIALGDSSIQKDIILNNVLNNKITFLNNTFPIEISILQHFFNNQKTKLNIFHNGKKILSELIDFTTNSITSKKLFLTANKVGLQHYRIQVKPLKGEVSTKNNYKDIYIEVLDGRQKILLLAASPHPDLGAIKSAIETNENYEVEIAYFSNYNAETKQYNLAIIHQPNKSALNTLNQLSKNNVPLWYILGNTFDVNFFNANNSNITITKSRGKTNEVQAVINKNFPLFNLSEPTTKFITSAPPLSLLFGEYKFKQESYVLLNQQVGNVTTNQPLFIFTQKINTKEAVLAAEGIWKWRLNNYLTEKTHDYFNEFIIKTVQFLSVKANKNKFRVELPKKINENDEIIFNAELYNESYELINEPEVGIKITNQDDKTFNYIFNKSNNAYSLNIGFLPAGLYNYKAFTKLGNKKYTAHGQFNINELNIENNTTIANFQLLQNLSHKTKGDFISAKEIESIPNLIKKNKDITSIVYEETSTKELINLKFIFYILLMLLTLEWFLRKRNGAY